MRWLRVAGGGGTAGRMRQRLGWEQADRPGTGPASDDVDSFRTDRPALWSPRASRPSSSRSRRPDGTTETYCVWLAATSPSERQQGLMKVTSLGGADGMLFRFGAEQSARSG